MSYWDQSPVIVHRQQFALSDKSSFITGPILNKFHKNVP